MASGYSYHPYDQDNQALTTTEFAGEQEQGSLLDITRKSRQPNQKMYRGAHRIKIKSQAAIAFGKIYIEPPRFLLMSR
jgi:hypothetical protein